MKLTHLFETPQNERQMRNAARRLIKEILNKKDDFLDEDAVKNVNRIRGDERYYPVVSMPTSYPDLHVGVMADLSTASFIQLSRNESTFHDAVKYLIVFPVRRNYRYPEEPSFENMKEIARDYLPNYYFLKGLMTDQQSTFIHEFTHYWDYSRAKSDLPTTYAGKDLEKYFNDPLERNAYFQEVMGRIDKNPRWFKLPFKEFLRKAFKLFEPAFLENLQGKGSIRIIQRLYAAWSAKQGIRA